jgi:bifunctional ADP-heptose synthase (sugar kinase/adenylyltransferase)
MLIVSHPNTSLLAINQEMTYVVIEEAKMVERARCLVVGGCTVDFLVRPLSSIGDKTYAEITHVCPGGSGRNVAIGLRTMGLNVTILASVGNDAFGDIIVAELKKLVSTRDSSSAFRP